MKYYIPTSSLNLDNILQAESISPFTFYAERETGYKQFEVIRELKGIDKIVLFEYPVRFTINDPNRYNYPLLIEVEDDIQLSRDSLHCESMGVFTYSKTLFLTPTNCRLFFFSESDYKLTTINTRSNKSIKHYEKYQIFSTTTGLLLKEMPIVEIEKRDCLTNSLEALTDKIKGMLYAHILGQSISISPELAHQKRLTQDIYDTISGIIANPSMSERLKPRLYNLLEEFKSIDSIEKDNELKFNSYLDTELEQYGVSASTLMNLLKRWNVWKPIHLKLSKEWGCDFLPQMPELISRGDLKKLGEDVERHTEKSIANYRKTMPHPSLSTIHYDGEKIIIEDLPIITIAVNYIINNKLTQDQLSAHRAELCLGIINEIKAYYFCEFGEDSWNKNVRAYVNTLYSHIQNLGIPFNIQSVENSELLAISAFLLKGNNIDNYLTFLKMNKIADYRCPLILWGVLCGYMEMSKDVLSNVLTMEYYEEVYRCLFKKEMFKAKWDDIKNIINNEDDSVDSNEFDSLLKSITKECPGARKDEPIYRDLYCHYGLSKELLEKIKIDNRLNKGKSVQKGVVRVIEKLLNSSKPTRRTKKNTTKNDAATLLLEIDYGTIPFYKDSNAWVLIQSMVPLQIRENVQKTFFWLQKEYQKGNSSNYYAKASRENSAVIEALKRMLLKKEYIVGKYEKDIEKIINYLHAQYDKR